MPLRTHEVPLKTILYARVSTTEQTLDHQRTQATKAGFVIDEVVADHGVSGLTTKLFERPEGRRLPDLLRSGDTLVVRWVDRLGRNYDDVRDAIQSLMRRGVIVRTVISDMTFDGSTKDPIQMAVRDALIGFMAATAQAQAEATKAAQRAGIDAARAREGSTRYLGRKPSFTHEQLIATQEALAQGTAPAVIARSVGISRQTVYRIKDDPMACLAALVAWDLELAV
jgi:DNA invertase Pin-like site-specific DNA recombinase